jgi:hypothetical protein
MDLKQLRENLEMRCIYPGLHYDPQADSIAAALQGRELEAVSYWGLFIAWIPLAQRTVELCLAAVRSHPRAIIWIPETVRTPPITWAAIEGDPMTIQFIYDPPLELAETAVRAAPGAAWILNPRMPEMETLSDQLRINAYADRTPRIHRSVSSTP